MDDWLPGLITKAQSGFFTVHTQRGEFVCQLRGRLKREKQETDIVALGDRVEISLVEDGSGLIETVAERERALVRRSPGSYIPGNKATGYDERGIEQVLVANPDQAVFVFACANPAPHVRMLDRFLVVAEANDIPAVICANKTDLVTAADAQQIFGPYVEIGYPVLFTSALTGQGVRALRQTLRGRISVLAGPSGVGKTSLLNGVRPGLGLQVRAVSRATTKGRHTTVHSQLWPVEGDGWVADTPGLRALALFDVEPEELDGYFVDIAPLVANCAFSDCTHVHEPGCAVRAALAAGRLHRSRYDSYLRMRAAEED